ncbi:MAG: hypothetical protein JOZ65_35930 [Chloroflexi bacterium]|nr:hypothetical protein [Chloroflexota bacterium]
MPEATARPPVEQPSNQAPKPPAEPPPERPPQTEEVLCTICGMRSCWR